MGGGSFRPSGSFLGINFLVFSATLRGIRCRYVDVCDRAGFFQKNPHEAKMTKNGQNWPLKRVFQDLRKVKSLAFSGNGVKRKYLWSKFYTWLSEKKEFVGANRPFFTRKWRIFIVLHALKGFFLVFAQ